jgi:hypothetical protein
MQTWPENCVCSDTLAEDGEGGYNPQEFEDESVQAVPRSPLFGDGADSEHSHECELGVPLFPLCGKGGSLGSVSSVRSHKGSCTNKQIHSIVKHVTNLKKSAVHLERSLPVSFQSVRGKLDVLWNNLESIKHVVLGSPQDCAGSTPLFQGHYLLNSMPPLEMLSPFALQVLMRQVVDKLWSSSFVTHNKMEARGTTGPDHAVADQFSGLGRRLAVVERQFTDPDGTLSKMEGRIVSLEDRRTADFIKCSKKAFQDIGAVAA